MLPSRAMKAFLWRGGRAGSESAHDAEPAGEVRAACECAKDQRAAADARRDATGKFASCVERRGCEDNRQVGSGADVEAVDDQLERACGQIRLDGHASPDGRDDRVGVDFGYLFADTLQEGVEAGGGVCAEVAPCLATPFDNGLLVDALATVEGTHEVALRCHEINVVCGPVQVGQHGDQCATGVAD